MSHVTAFRDPQHVSNNPRQTTPLLEDPKQMCPMARLSIVSQLGVEFIEVVRLMVAEPSRRGIDQLSHQDASRCRRPYPQLDPADSANGMISRRESYDFPPAACQCQQQPATHQRLRFRSPDRVQHDLQQDPALPVTPQPNITCQAPDFSRPLTVLDRPDTPPNLSAAPRP